MRWYNEKICSNCKYFIQHYIKVNNKFVATYCGSCIRFCKVETLATVQDACKYFIDKEPYKNM